MGSMGVNLDQPPAAPPGGAGQPLSGFSSMFRGQMQQQQQPGATPPGPATGAIDPQKLQVLYEAVKRGLQALAGNPKFAPFAERMLAIGDAGLKESMGGDQQNPGAPPMGQGPQPPQSGAAPASPTPA